ncbi:MAG: hypothetical protein ACLQMF_20315 [Rectinemataceae bacterium]
MKLKICFRLGNRPEEEVLVSSFPEFKAWLWSFGVGVKADDREAIAWWAETYSRLTTEGLTKPILFARARVDYPEPTEVAILRVER